MITAFAIIVIIAAALHGYRQYWTLRQLPQLHTAHFDGQLYRVGDTYIAKRAARDNSQRTIICFPGFLEDMRYFQALYHDDNCELILVNNANYHCPFIASTATPLNWPSNPYAMGTIEHDGFYLGLALEQLASGKHISMHGHSRGGAVVLEAGRQYPQLMQTEQQSITAILEAAVLPQAVTAGNGSRPLMHKLTCYFLPIVLGLSRHTKADKLDRQAMMRPTNALKTQLCLSVYSVARCYATCVVNIQSIINWQRDTPTDIYRHFATVQVVMGARDSVLDNTSMRVSAECGQALNSGVNIIPTEHTNHFVSLEQPAIMRTLQPTD